MHINIETVKVLVRLVGGRVRLTSIRYGDVPIDPGKFFRFERRVAHVQMPGKHDPEGVIVVRLEKLAPAEYELVRRDRVYFESETRKWFAPTKDNTEIIFRPELVGAFYLTERAWMADFGFVIAGHDVRKVMFLAFYRQREEKRGLFKEPFAIINAVNEKGGALVVCARQLLQEHPEWFTPEEGRLIKEYLGAR